MPSALPARYTAYRAEPGSPEAISGVLGLCRPDVTTRDRMTVEPRLPAHAPDIGLHIPHAYGGAPRMAAVRCPLTVIGSRQGCRIRLESAKVSPLHCALINSGRGLVLRDLAGVLGTSVNDWESDACLLADGDRIQIRSREFLVRMDLPIIGEGTATPDHGGVGSTSGPRIALRDESGRVLDVSGAPVVLLGRHSRCDLTLGDLKVSRAHALLYRVDDQWTVADLLSANGTGLNGAALDQPRILGDGDVLRLGSSQVRVRLGDAQPIALVTADGRGKTAVTDNHDTLAGELQTKIGFLDTRQAELDERAAELEAKAGALGYREAKVDAQLARVRDGTIGLEQSERKAAHLAAVLDARQAELDDREQAHAAARDELEHRLAEVALAEEVVARSTEALRQHEDRVRKMQGELDGRREETEADLDARQADLDERRADLEVERETVERQAAQFRAGTQQLRSAVEAVKGREAAVEDDRADLDRREAAMAATQEAVDQRIVALDPRERALANAEARQRESATLITDINSNLTTWEQELCGVERLLHTRARELDKKLEHLLTRPDAAANGLFQSK